MEVLYRFAVSIKNMNIYDVTPDAVLINSITHWRNRIVMKIYKESEWNQKI